MLGEPGGPALRRARGQQGKHLLMLQIDQEGPVAWPAPPGPRIDPKHLGSGGGGPWGRPYQASQGGRTDGPPHTGHETDTGLPPRATPQALRRWLSRVVRRAQGAATGGRRSGKI